MSGRPTPLATDVAIAVDPAEPVQPSGDGCPRCMATGATMTLLTSMTRYFMCDGCGCRWHVSRPFGSDKT